jgi:uncharacterized protein
MIAALFFASPALAQSTGVPDQPVPHRPATSPTRSSPSAQAPASQPPATTPEKVDPAKEAAIRHLMDITATSKLGENVSSYISSQVQTAMSHTMQPDRVPKFMDTFNEKFAAGAPPSAITDAMVPIYAKAFSMEDIQGLVQFYESPLGQHVVKVLPQVLEESQTAGMQIDRKIALDVLRGMSDEYPELKRMLPAENGQPGPSPDTNTTPEKSPSAPPTPAPQP